MRIVAKIGSSSLVGADGAVDGATLARIATDVAAVRAAGGEVVLVSSGAIASGLGVLGRRERPRDLPSLQAASAIGQGALFAAWAARFSELGLVAGQVLLTMQDVSHRAAYVNARNTLTQLLAWGAVPIVNENDTTATDEISFGDNDALAAQVAVAIGADQLLLMTDVDGIYDRPPSEPGATLLERIDDHDVLRSIDAGGTGSSWGTGGMRSKLVAAEMASIGGVTTQILSCATVSVLVRAARGERVGTLVEAAAERHGSSYRLWLRYGKPERGTLHVDDGAALALVDRGASLLAVGITGADGDFRTGDAVTVTRRDGTVIAKGIVQFDADRLRHQIAEGDRARDQRAVIHRDQLVVI